jgi:hypothetical protein
MVFRKPLQWAGAAVSSLFGFFALIRIVNSFIVIIMVVIVGVTIIAIIVVTIVVIVIILDIAIGESESEVDTLLLGLGLCIEHRLSDDSAPKTRHGQPLAFQKSTHFARCRSVSKIGLVGR